MSNFVQWLSSNSLGIAVVITAIVMALVFWKRSNTLILEDVPLDDEEGMKKKGRPEKKSRWKWRAGVLIFKILFFALAIPLGFAFGPPWLGFVLVFAALWTAMSTVVTHPVEFANRISAGERVPIDEGGILKEGTDTNGKMPWEQVEYFDHTLKNYQGSVTLITDTGNGEKDEETKKVGPQGRGELNLEFTYQARTNAEVGDAQGRLRWREMDQSIIKVGVEDAIEGELVSEASRVSLDKALGHKEELELMARAVVELETMPDRDKDFFKKYNIQGEFPVAGKRLDFYRKHIENLKVWFKDSRNRRMTSINEDMYGLDVVRFILTKVLPSKEVTRAMEYPRMAEALGAAEDVFLAKPEYKGKPEAAARMALLAAGLIRGVDIASKGGGVIPIVTSGDGHGDDHGGHSDKSHGHGKGGDHAGHH